MLETIFMIYRRGGGLELHSSKSDCRDWRITKFQVTRYSTNGQDKYVQFQPHLNIPWYSYDFPAFPNKQVEYTKDNCSLETGELGPHENIQFEQVKSVVVWTPLTVDHMLYKRTQGRSA